MTNKQSLKQQKDKAVRSLVQLVKSARAANPNPQDKSAEEQARREDTKRELLTLLKIKKQKFTVPELLQAILKLDPDQLDKLEQFIDQHQSRRYDTH